ARSQVIFVSPLHPEDRAVLVALRARGYSVAVISPDPTAEEARLGSGGHSHAETAPFSTALRLAGLERSLLIAGLRRAGVSVVDWRCGDAPAETLRSSLARQPLWERAGGNRR
ncbi:MAG TPA: hypothetical protein VL359_13970, partial [bacterium]|nr:hypothetical protein [bacterium]